MEAMWRRVGLHSVRNKRTHGTNTNAQNNEAQSQPPSQPQVNVNHDCPSSSGINVNSQPRAAEVVVSSDKRRRRRRRSRHRRTSNSASNQNTRDTKDSKGGGGSENTDQLCAKPRGARNDPSLRQRAVARLRMLNFHIFDSHNMECKPCRPRGNIITRRLCRGRREDNELYRSNSFKFERFERQDGVENGALLRKQLIIIALVGVCAAYRWDSSPSKSFLAPLRPYAAPKVAAVQYLPPVEKQYLPPVVKQYLPPVVKQYLPPVEKQYVQPVAYIQKSVTPATPIVKYANEPNAGDGAYSFEYETANGIMQREQGRQVGAEEEAVEGSYSYTGPDGVVYTVNYWADANGFHATGAHLPTPPPIPEAIQRSIEVNAAAEAARQAHGYQYVAPQSAESSGKAHVYLPPKIARVDNGYKY